MVVIMTLTAAPLSGFVGLDLPSLFDFKAEAAETYSGTCGDNLTWVLNASTGVLTINGSGEMQDSNEYDIIEWLILPPWSKYVNDIKSIHISNGVTTIGSFAFRGCENLTNVIIPDSVTSIGIYAFYGCKSLKSITIPGKVTSVGEAAFGYCDSLTSVTIPDSVTTIDSYAFYSCDSLASITIPNSVTSIGYSAFEDCTSLASINIPASIKSVGSSAFFDTKYYNTSSNWDNGILYIGNVLANAKTSLSGNVTVESGTKLIADDAFEDCTNITGVTIPNSVTSIGSDAFYSCDSLVSITIPDSVTSIGEGAFYKTGYYNTSSNWDNGILYIGNVLVNAKTSLSGNVTVKSGTKFIADEAFEYCSNLTGVTIPNGVTTIGNYAFSGCDSLTSVTIPNSVTTIGDRAFSSCENLSSITIPDSVTNIGDYAFIWCESLASVSIPGSVTSIGDSAFRGCDSLTSINVDENNKYYSSDKDGILFNKNKTKLIQYPSGRNNTSYTIPHSVIIIGDFAFYGCENLTSVTISDNVTTISDYAFSQCYNINNVKLGNNVTEIGFAAFSYTSLTSIDIPDSITSIGLCAFAVCNYLNSVTIGEGVINIGDLAFIACNLNNITVDVNNKYYSSDDRGVLFDKNKTKLIQYPIGNKSSSYSIPKSTENIWDFAFYFCPNLTSLTIPNSIKSIGAMAIGGCTGLTSVKIPNSVTTIEEYAFYYCANIENLTLGNSVTSIGDAAFSDCTSLTSVTIPDSVTTIGNRAFAWCDSLTSVTIGNSVTTIGVYAFEDCANLDYIHIPDNVTFIKGDILDGTEAYICSDSEDCYARTYAEENDIEFKLCTGHETEHKHTPKKVTVPASCTVNGMEYTVCEECGEPIGEATIIPAAHKWGEWETVKEATCKAAGERVQKCTVCGEVLDTEIIPQKDHVPGEWETVIEPTADTEGKRIKKCTVCGDVLEEEAIPKLEISTAVDDKTGIEIEYVSNDYDGEVSISVEEAFDGEAFDVIDTTLNSTQKFIYDITMTVNGVATQPNGKVTVRIPLPEGYDPTRTFVYHINSNTGTVEPMYAEYSDGYMVFETTHFSYYALVEVLDVELKINRASTNIINFGDTLVLTLDEIEIPAGYAVEWFVEGMGVSIEVNEDGTECRVTSVANGNPTICAKLIDEEENVITNVDGEEISDAITLTSKAGFFQKLISFFKNLFGINRDIY